MTNLAALRLFTVEMLGLAMMFWILRLRGAPLATWGFKPSWKSTGAGVLLWLATMVALGVVVLPARTIYHGIMPAHPPLVSHVSLPFLILNSVSNPVFEETLEAGYFIQ